MLTTRNLYAYWSLLLGPALASAQTVEAEPMISLGDSLAPLQAQFNADKDKTRVVALLSPT